MEPQVERRKQLSARSKPKAKEDGLDLKTNRDAMMAAALKKEFGSDFCDIIVDPDAPTRTATDWIPMPGWWTELVDVPGVAAGHVTIIQGKPDCGKTTLAMEVMIQAQKMGWYVVLIDSEFKFNMDRFKSMGGDVTRLIVIRAETLELCFDRMEKTIDKIRARDKDARIMFPWDSLGFTPTQQEMDGGSDNQAPATAARVIKRNLRRLVAKIHSQRVAVVIVNHIYSKIGNVMFGDSTTGYGGSGAYYAAVVVVEVKMIGKIRRQIKGEKLEYLRVQLKLRKNHLSSNQGTVRVVNVMPTGIELIANSKAAKLDDGEEMVPEGPVPNKGRLSLKDEAEEAMMAEPDDGSDLEDDIAPPPPSKAKSKPKVKHKVKADAEAED